MVVLGITINRHEAMIVMGLVQYSGQYSTVFVPQQQEEWLCGYPALAPRRVDVATALTLPNNLPGYRFWLVPRAVMSTDGKMVGPPMV